MKKEHKYIPYTFPVSTPKQQFVNSNEFKNKINGRRTVRTFSERPVAREVIENILLSASSAPSGAHKQPWYFCAVSDPVIKRKIREAAEQEEYLSYTQRMSQEWKDDLKPLGTDWKKPFLEKAPWLIVVFMQNYALVNGEKKKNYYVKESVGLATGILLTAAFNAGLASLTYTPSPMGFLSEILGRPENEKPYMVVPVGFPEEGTKVPDLTRKSLDQIATFYI